MIRSVPHDRLDERGFGSVAGDPHPLPGCWIGVLGPLSVMHDGAGVPCPAGPRTVLGLLALACVAAVSRHLRALKLWRGDPLDEIPQLRAHPAVVALEEKRATAILDYADGSYREAAVHLAESLSISGGSGRPVGSGKCRNCS